MKIVKFNDGTYGVRRGFWPFYEYKDFYSLGFWWSLGDYPNSIRTTRKNAYKYVDKGVPEGDYDI